MKAWIDPCGGMLWMGVMVLIVFYAIAALTPQASAAEPDATKDLRGRIVVVREAEGKPVAWFFDKKDELTLKIIDQHNDGKKDFYYAELSSKTKDGVTLKGIIELYYLTINKKQYLVDVQSITLEAAVPEKPKTEKPAQKPPEKPPGE